MTTLQQVSFSITLTADETHLPSILMIIDFKHSFKNYYEILNFYGIWEYRCPKCGAVHSFHRHAAYSRNLIVWDSGSLVENQMTILRLQCNSCGSTHAVLTPDIIPFFIYSIEAFLELLSLCLNTEGSVLKTEKETEVTYQLLYQFLRIFHSYRKQLILFLRRESLWYRNVHPLIRELLPFLCARPFPWFPVRFFILFQSPPFLHRRNTVSYPLFFGSCPMQTVLPT